MVTLNTYTRTAVMVNIDPVFAFTVLSLRLWSGH